MVCTNLCPFDNTNCMCQFCENPCNNGLNCSDCQFHNKIMHTIYLCTGFEGDFDKYLENWKRGSAGESVHESKGE